jgi:hypothetical protein
VAETTVKRLLCCGFGLTGKAMGQLYQSWWRLCQEIDVFPSFKYHVLCFTSICDRFNDSVLHVISPIRLHGTVLN